ncbi:MAG: salicylate hydroxylase [Rhizobiales bacterium]|nr:salicylate hydroxylase [Hyphomicrobiales bacterium]MBG18572.1 salicylate hydroxylase [Hyphomicrobiales bacterium]|tara:strand:- start:283 stop:1425 length:1143 start_codon:yes stop_codon:yes gene_type:complete
MTGKTVDIIGAGIAGLTAALAFSRLGWTVRLREQAAELREVGAGLQLSPNATRILLALGLGERLAPSLHKPGRIALASGISLDTIAYVPAGAEAEKRWKAPYGVIHRADLQTVLFEAAEETQEISVELGCRTEPGDIGDSDADLVVIADGVWSANRSRLKHAGSPSFTGLVAWRLLVDADVAASYIDPLNVTAFMGPESHLVAYPVKGGTKVNMVAITSGEDPGRDWSYATSTGNRARLFERFSRWHPALRTAMRDAEEITYWPLYQMSDGAYFDGGKTVLIGDAAHAMAPFAAQGAAMAIEDAWELTAAAGEGRTAIFNWESQRRARVARARKRAAFNRFAYHARGPVRLGRDLVLSLRKPEQLAADLDWLYGWRGTGL